MRLEYDTYCGHVTQYVYFNNTCYYGYSYSVYPNPADNELTVSYKSTETSTSITLEKKEFMVELFNNKGEKVRIASNKGNKSITFDTQTITEGTYYLHITEDNKTIKKQVIVEHKK